MALNESAQSVLHRFHDKQAADLGVGRRKNERPKLVSGVTNLRECEKWRGDVLRDIDRKVSRIQDFGLNDYEIRDLNDEINQLFREKNQWERQIVSLGGANYLGAAQWNMDEDGNEIPGMRGYKYFGRAKDLPGVRELFNRTAEQEEEIESYRTQKYRRFQHQSGAYFGNEDEQDGIMLAEEIASEELGWEKGWERVMAKMGIEDVPPPAIPRAEPVKLALAQDTPDNDALDAALPMLTALDAQELIAPKVAQREDIESFLLQAKKAALRSEYLAT
ncbi:NineTeen Complex (NTC) component [Malassezia vespertilionis]|uniref:Isy1p n=1 Tax=Malassezia vespertilionis TaxID=2020962 RepID=A0A2N1JGL3_9BASI|nr:NineTeen Complex (NTC) component [Malassezia vespertilionis]PKI85692.1 Isy1p [Malassezia vespertilionis]WFD04932.1 NineTeen Complex (NTC) component [Malassezia vespertilionis]